MTSPKRLGVCREGTQSCMQRRSLRKTGDHPAPSLPSQERPSLALTAGDAPAPGGQTPRVRASWAVGYSIPCSNGFGWMAVRGCVAPPELVGQATWQGSRAGVDSIPFFHGGGEEGKPLPATAESEDGGGSPWLEPGGAWLCELRSPGSACFSEDAFALRKGCS